VKFCQFVANLYPHILASFGLFISIFSKMR